MHVYALVVYTLSGLSLCLPDPTWKSLYNGCGSGVQQLSGSQMKWYF